MLKKGKDGSIQIDKVDKGNLFFSLAKDGDNFVLSETRIDLYGSYGAFTSHIIVPELKGVIDFFLTDLLNSEDEEC